jgi:SagB-type dehydrogenase family enzyme
MSLFRRRTPTPPDRGRSPGEIARAYHERTKHHSHRYAAALGFLDWENQPDPFRRYAGAPLLPLPRPQRDETFPYERLFEPAGAPAPLTLASLSSFFYYGLALSAWKRAGEAHWALRVNPSSGNLHPTEGWALLPALPDTGGQPGLFHYAPKEHALERRAHWPDPAWRALGALLAGPAGPAGSGADAAPGSPGFLVALSSVPWRESWKYGERAWRYCQHDAGHALASLRCAAALQGWSLTCLSAVDDALLGALLGLDRAGEFPPGEPEHPDLLAHVSCGGAAPPAEPLREALGRLAAAATWAGTPNTLSAEHHEWEVIEIVDAACRKTPEWCAGQSFVTGPAQAQPRGAGQTTGAPTGAMGEAMAGATGGAMEVPAPAKPGERSAGDVIRRRRSAVAMDGHTGLTARGFCEILQRTLPLPGRAPWDALDWAPLVDLALFVHRVQDVPPGLYALVRNPADLEELRAACAPECLWQRAPAAPPELPLFLLRAGDARSLATGVSCGQDIAGMSAFSLGMLARFEPELARHGAPAYRHMFWETGVLGQVLYLEAEAAGIAATGIGCFFDDSVHHALGLRDRTFQSLYHFTVGGAVEDGRLTTEPAYLGPGVP